MSHMNRKFGILLILSVILPCALYAGVDFPKKGSAPHPRLILKAGQEHVIKEMIESDPHARALDSAIMHFCRQRILEPLPTNERDAAGVRLKNVALIDKDLNLFAYAARVHNDQECRKRAIDEMMTVCSFPDWSPTHFLDPSELAFAVSICYDWLYDYLTPKQRRDVRNALLKNNMLPSFEKHPDHYFYSSTNWNSVCNCGAVAAALNVYEEFPVEAEKILERCLLGNPNVLNSYNPTGAYPEGFGYWSFGTNHEVLLLDMLESLFGNDFGLAQSAPGFMKTPRFILHMTGPFWQGFNYGDNEPGNRLHPAVFWFAKKELDPSLLYLEKKYMLSGEELTFGNGYALPAMMVWYSQMGKCEEQTPRELVYENEDPKIPLFIYRSDWENSNAAYLGIKAGNMRKNNHGHIDAGGFVYYRDAVRWVADLGTPKYAFVEQYIGHKPLFTQTQESRRWEVLREGAEGHSIVTFDGIRPTVDCYCNFLKTFKTKGQKGAMMDLTPMYPDQVEKYIRMVYADVMDNLVVTEKFVGAQKDRHVKWNLVTESDAIVLEDGKVQLEKDGKMRILSISTNDVPLTIKVVPAESGNPWDQKNEGINFVQCEFVLPAATTVNMITTIK